MTCIFKWIHFSDIHFQAKERGFNSCQLLKKLPEYVKQLHLNVDAMFFTGDFRFAPENNNELKVVPYIKELMNVVGITDATKVVTVPGNHDLTRKKPRDFIVKGCLNDYNPEIGLIDCESLKSLLKDFDFYDKLHEELGDANNYNESNPHVIVEYSTCNILALNTALCAYGDQDCGNLILGSKYVLEALNKIENTKPIIAIGHHSFAELREDERKIITQYLEQRGIRLYLCGHSHVEWCQAFAEGGKEVIIGCMKQENHEVKVGFEVGELRESGDVCIEFHGWDMSQKIWHREEQNKKEFKSLYSIEKEKTEVTGPSGIVKIDNLFSIEGYTLLGSRGIEGIKYYWKKGDSYVESLALNKRVKEQPSEMDDKISAYTISTSIGCYLSIQKNQCKFCETGSKDFKGFLRPEEIALQCVFMAEYDRDCPSYLQVRDNFREFAFMGQGETGCNYDNIRQAIRITDYAMEKLEQKVHRYVISTSGMFDFIPSLVVDIENGIFKHNVTIHLSLHEIDEKRDEIMPINKIYNYKEAIKYCEKLYKVTGSKIGVGILMFHGYETIDKNKYTLKPDRLSAILDKLDNEVFKIDLCTVNDTSVGRQRRSLSNAEATELKNVATKKGFECKMFSSFGDNQKSGCGMLASDIKEMEKAGSTTISHFNTAIGLVEEAKSTLF